MTKRSALQMALCTVSLTFFYAASASAYMNGIDGVSGKNNTYCRNCHAGGTTPSVAFDGPTVMTPGSTANFDFTVTSHSASQIKAGLDVAASAGTLDVIAGQGTHVQFGEVTHDSPKANDANGQANFEFTWKAPANSGTYTLYGAGCSVNGNGQQTGDAGAKTTYAIVVGVNIPTPTPPAPPPTATATATAAVKVCVGDCGGDGEVTVDELITGVNIALGVTPVSACPVFDSSGDGEVTIDELLQAVNNALNACPA
ncbi:MAG TPA: choice-of-anchor V domain-containing protein [Candidatus Acidoferrales bacterium]|nr:choice-of-anchor V domain-containing protein [Candidatus Acidoferrales bacterium]